MLDPAYFQRPATYVDAKHPRLGESKVEQRPFRNKLCFVQCKDCNCGKKPTTDNCGTSCKPA